MLPSLHLWAIFIPSWLGWAPSNPVGCQWWEFIKRYTLNLLQSLKKLWCLYSTLTFPFAVMVTLIDLIAHTLVLNRYALTYKCTVLLTFFVIRQKCWVKDKKSNSWRDYGLKVISSCECRSVRLQYCVFLNWEFCRVKNQEQLLI